MEPKEAGFDVGERQAGRLMRINRIELGHTCKHKVTTDSNRRLGVAANWLDEDFAADAPNCKWAGAITYIRTSEGGSTLPSFSICIADVSWAGQSATV